MIHDMITARIPIGYPSGIRSRTRSRMDNEIFDRGVEVRSQDRSSKLAKSLGKV